MKYKHLLLSWIILIIGIMFLIGTSEKYLLIGILLIGFALGIIITNFLQKQHLKRSKSYKL